MLKVALSTPQNADVILHYTERRNQDFFLFYEDFLSRTLMNHRTAGEGGAHFINSSLPFPPASQTLRHQPCDYCRELTSVHNPQPDSNREPLVSERKSLTTKLLALMDIKQFLQLFTLYPRVSKGCAEILWNTL